MTIGYVKRRRRVVLPVLASAAGGLAVCWLGAVWESGCLVFLGAIILVPAVIAAEVGFIRLLERYCPLRLEYSLGIAAAVGAVCCVVKLCTGCPWLGLVGVLLIVPLVLMRLFWPMAMLGMWICESVTGLYARLTRPFRRG
ncbi:MAG: hypothetical protein ACUVUC_16630 [Thermoguttaceae bacterium]